MWKDLRWAVRSLARSPAFALTAILSIGVGIGANTTVFAWLDNIVSRPFPAIPDGNQLVALNVGDMDGRVEGMSPIAYPVLEEWRSRTASFDSIAAHAQARLSLRPTPTAVAEPVWVELVSSNFFATLEVRAHQGRLFDAGDEKDRTDVVVLSHAFWQRQFGGSSETIGQRVLFNGVSLTVIGIAPPRFDGVVTGLAFDAFVPLWLQPTLIPGSDWLRDRTARRLQAVGRLRPGATLESARQELNGAALEVSRWFGESPLTGAGARWISDTQLGSLMGPLSLAMLGVTVVVLAASCANVAGLLLARGVARQRETAIQIAMGASRRRLMQQALVQAAVLTLAGCVVGIWVAELTRNALTRFVPRVSLPVSLEIDLNWRVLLFAAALALCSGLLCSVVPAFRASRPDIVDVLKSASGGGSGRRSRLRQGLVVAQVALTLVALAVAGLFLRSVAAAGKVPLGFGEPSEVLLVSTDLAFTRLVGPPLVVLVDRTLEQVRGLPGVTAASVATFVPLSFGGPPGVATQVDGYVPRPDESMVVGRAAISDGYFETMGILTAEGRLVTTIDRAESDRVVVVNEAFVARYWPGQSAIGRRLDQGDGWATVVGVVRNSAVDSLTEAPRPLVYHPWAQRPSNVLTLHVRTSGNPLALVEPVRRQFAAVHPELPALDPGTLADHMQAATFVQFVGATAFSIFGLVGLSIAAIGLHGVVAQFSAERRRDIAISMALGAGPANVVAMVIGPALRLTSIGLVVGGMLSVAAGTLVRNQLVGVDGIDAVALAGAIGLLATITLAGCAWPTWRATRPDLAVGVGSI